MPISHVSKILVGDVVIACYILLFLLTKLHQFEILMFSHDPQSCSYGFLSILYTAGIYQLCLPIQIFSLEKVCSYQGTFTSTIQQCICWYKPSTFWLYFNSSNLKEHCLVFCSLGYAYLSGVRWFSSQPGRKHLFFELHLSALWFLFTNFILSVPVISSYFLHL